MEEYGIADDVVAISGTSIGGINGALFASVKDVDAIKRFWVEEVENILVLDKEKVGEDLRATMTQVSESIDIYYWLLCLFREVQ